MIVQNVGNVVVKVVPGLKGIVVKAARGEVVNVTPTRTGVRIGGRSTETTLRAEHDQPVGVAVPRMDTDTQRVIWRVDATGTSFDKATN